MKKRGQNHAKNKLKIRNREIKRWKEKMIKRECEEKIIGIKQNNNNRFQAENKPWNLLVFFYWNDIQFSNLKLFLILKMLLDSKVVLNKFLKIIIRLK